MDITPEMYDRLLTVAHAMVEGIPGLDPKDAVQDAIVSVIESGKGPCLTPEDLEAALRFSLRGHAYRARGMSKRDPVKFRWPHFALEKAPDLAMHDDEYAAKRECREAEVHTVLDQLSPKMQTVLKTYYQYEGDEKKVADALEVSIKSVRMYLTRARRAFKAHLPGLDQVADLRCEGCQSIWSGLFPQKSTGPGDPYRTENETVREHVLGPDGEQIPSVDRASLKARCQSSRNRSADDPSSNTGHQQSET